MRIYSTLLLLFFAVVISQAQEKHSERKERIKALKVAFLTERLELSAKEAQIFWPIYNDFEETMDRIHHNERKVFKNKSKEFDTMDEATAQMLLENHQSFEQQKQDAKSTLLGLLKDTFSYKKTLILLKAEGDFKRDLLRKLRDKRKDKDKRPRP